MKHTLLFSLIVLNSLYAQDEKPPRTKTFAVSIINKSSSSSSSNGYDTPVTIAVRRARAPGIPQKVQEIQPDTLRAYQPAHTEEFYEEQQPVYVVTPQPSVDTPARSAYLPSLQDISQWTHNTLFSVNPITITAGALLSLYVVYQIKMYNLASYALKRNTWSTWKEHIPLEVMIEVPHQEVAEELFNAIKSKYLPVHSTDMMTPMVKFNNAVDRELQRLNQFLQLQEWFSYTKLSYLFPSYEKEVATAKVKIKRLVFFKDVLLAWMNEYSTAIMHDRFIPRSNYYEPAINECHLIAATTTECN